MNRRTVVIALLAAHAVLAEPVGIYGQERTVRRAEIDRLQHFDEAAVFAFAALAGFLGTPAAKLISRAET